MGDLEGMGQMGDLEVMGKMEGSEGMGKMEILELQCSLHYSLSLWKSSLYTMQSEYLPA
jgi:hypothetical protein